MKRDMNLIREILLWAEDQEHAMYAHSSPKIEDYSVEQVGYHIYLMHDAGLVKAIDMTAGKDESPNWKLISLTWQGHEFLGETRDETIWNKAKKTILTTTASISFDILVEWLKAEARAKLGLS